MIRNYLLQNYYTIILLILSIPAGPHQLQPGRLEAVPKSAAGRLIMIMIMIMTMIMIMITIMKHINDNDNDNDNDNNSDNSCR